MLNKPKDTKRLLALFFILMTGTIFAAPKLSTAILRQGINTVKGEGDVVDLIWKIKNPETTEQTVSMQLRPENGDMQTIYTKDITIPAESSLSGIISVISPHAEEVLVELLQNGNVIDKDNVLLRGRKINQFHAAILNDGEPVEATTEIRKGDKGIIIRELTTYQHNLAATNWYKYSNYQAVIINDPNLQKYTEMQYGAIIDYVMQGGMAIISTPECAMMLDETPLSSLLPYTPINTFSFDGYEEFSAAMGDNTWKAKDELDAEGFATGKRRQIFLNAIPKNESTVLFTVGNRPAAVLMRYGRGTVLGLCFSLFDTCDVNKNLIPQLWDMIEQCSGFQGTTGSPDETPHINGILQMLQGYRIPSINYITTLLALYIILGAAILIVAIRMKRHVTGWFLVILLGCIFTTFIMLHSKSISNIDTTLSATTFKLSTWDGGFGAERNDTILLARQDLQPSIHTGTSDLFIHSQPPAVNTVKTAISSVPLRVNINNAEQELKGFTLQQMRPRTIRWDQAAPEHSHNKAELPSLSIKGQEIVLNDWTVPEELSSASRAMLAMPGAVRALVLSNGKITDDGTASRLEADTVFTSAMEYVKALPCPSPCVVLLMQIQDKPSEVLAIDLEQGDNTQTYDYQLVFIQARMPQEKPAVIPQSFVHNIIPNSSLLRTYQRNGEWYEITGALALETSYEIWFCIPPEMAVSNPDKVIIKADVYSPSGKLSIRTELLTVDDKAINPSKVDGANYIFDTKGMQIVNTHDGHLKFNIVVALKSDEPIMNPRSATWKINDLAATIINKE